MWAGDTAEKNVRYSSYVTYVAIFTEINPSNRFVIPCPTDSQAGLLSTFYSLLSTFLKGVYD